MVAWQKNLPEAWMCVRTEIAERAMATLGGIRGHMWRNQPRPIDVDKGWWGRPPTDGETSARHIGMLSIRL